MKKVLSLLAVLLLTLGLVSAYGDSTVYGNYFANVMKQKEDCRKKRRKNVRQ